MAIGGETIIYYQWIFHCKPLVVIDGYFINGYCIISYCHLRSLYFILDYFKLLYIE